MKWTQFVSALLVLAATGIVTEAQTPIPASAVVEGGGEGTCVWRTGPYSGCSTTCIGVQTRDVSCICTVSTMEVTATDDNCFRDSELLQPISTRSCGRECPDTPRPTVCRWHTTTYYSCSATCEGSMTRDVSCRCTLHTGETTIGSDDDCSLALKPRGSRGCGSECPTPTPSLPPGPVCRWETSKFSGCSSTCEGLRTRRVDCRCTLYTGETTIESDNVDCLRQDGRKPKFWDMCGSPCPPTPKPSLPPATEQTQDVEPRECNLTECRDQGDCYDDECCLQVHVSKRKYSSEFFCFPLVELNDVCDVEANWTCPCADGLECRSDSSSYRKRGSSSNGYHSKGKDAFYKFGKRVHWDKYDKCPSLYKKEHKPKYADAVCAAKTSGSQARSQPSSCNLTECRNGGDCNDDECCLEVEFYEGGRKTLESFCFPLMDEDEACDLNGEWSCPCGDSLTCTHQYRNGGKSHKGKDLGKYYRPKVVLEEGEECPNLYNGKRRKADKYTPTCQKVSNRRHGRATTKEERPVVVVLTEQDD